MILPEFRRFTPGSTDTTTTDIRLWAEAGRLYSMKTRPDAPAVIVDHISAFAAKLTALGYKKNFALSNHFEITKWDAVLCTLAKRHAELRSFSMPRGLLRDVYPSTNLATIVGDGSLALGDRILAGEFGDVGIYQCTICGERDGDPLVLRLLAYQGNIENMPTIPAVVASDEFADNCIALLRKFILFGPPSGAWNESI